MTSNASASQHGHASETAYLWIKQKILANRWPDGAALKESDLSKEIGVSRTPVRDALRRLTLEGLVETIPNQGSRLKRWDSDDLEEIFGLRVVLESYGARIAATRVTEKELVQLHALCDSMEALVAEGVQSAEAKQQLTRLNERFHEAILQAAHSRRLAALAAQVISFPLVYRTFETYDPKEIVRSMAHHRELLDAFGVRDPVWAESIMRAHLSAGHRSSRRSLIKIAKGGVNA
ncbi:GntR family transcriptional regulator [Allopusillimonas ginsengisoli]|uniref:GntR family transcriptional regulator n=1 Tax=Allopusillimonas ginsengisoli TaxID=453575 RepID=UPI0010C1EC82|nr:GntR family transcriptional regulator [Allopusillimonas ginsengisoli]